MYCFRHVSMLTSNLEAFTLMTLMEVGLNFLSCAVLCCNCVCVTPVFGGAAYVFRSTSVWATLPADITLLLRMSSNSLIPESIPRLLLIDFNFPRPLNF
jgi:hypothetical protein